LNWLDLMLRRETHSGYLRVARVVELQQKEEETAAVSRDPDRVEYRKRLPN
jgi:hypothetical protein